MCAAPAGERAGTLIAAGRYGALQLVDSPHDAA